MTLLARLAAALYGAMSALVPIAALAQNAGGTNPAPAGTRNLGWLWLLAAVLIVVALFRMFFGRTHRSAPSRRP
jgi:hypothetical protein